MSVDTKLAIKEFSEMIKQLTQESSETKDIYMAYS